VLNTLFWCSQCDAFDLFLCRYLALHNSNDTDEYTKIHIPGATRIKVVFDPSSATEANCDYVRLLNSDNRELPAYGQDKYSGRGSGRVWAGVDSHPAVVIPADCFEVHFHSDASNTDHGFKLLAYGVVEEPTAEDRAQFAALRRKVTSLLPAYIVLQCCKRYCYLTCVACCAHDAHLSCDCLLRCISFKRCSSCC
jgi:hypothetical protein